MKTTTTEKTTITVETTVNAPVEKTWNYWVDPFHMLHWNFATDEWHCPWAKNDVREGGRITSRMEAKDGSMGFDFSGKYTKVTPLKELVFKIDDGREVAVSFSRQGNGTRVTETFEAEQVNSIEMQRGGWQTILDNFKKHVENDKLEAVHFEITIDKSPAKVYQAMFDEKNYKEWTAIFNPSSEFVGSWEKGSKILFLGIGEDGKKGGMVSRIKENIPNEFVSIEHLGVVNEGKEVYEGPEVDAWKGGIEHYTFTEVNGQTRLIVDTDTSPAFKSYFMDAWPPALKKLKDICER